MRSRTMLAILLPIGLGWSTGCIEMQEPANAPQQAAQEQPPMEAQVAKVGVGVKGQSLQEGGENDPRRIITGPAIAYFNTKQKIVFEIQIPHAMNLYEAEKGRYPRSHQQFMDEIINVNKIPLPELPKGMIYRYHPDDHQLWVEPENKEKE